jgi:polysaccharide pyruvyl transferase WcaK-like protein
MKNAGDFAITLGTIDYFHSRGHEIDVLSKDCVNDVNYVKSEKYLKNRYHDISIYPNKFKLRRKNKLLLLIDYTIGFFKTIFCCHRRYYKTLFNRYDSILFGGGNILRGESFHDYIRLRAMVYPLRFAKNKPIYILPSSTSNTNTMCKRIIGRLIGESETCFVREKESFERFLAMYPIFADKFLLGIDMAFYAISGGEQNPIKQPSKEEGEIGITIRAKTIGDLYDFSSDKKMQITQDILSFIKCNKHRKFKFIVQTNEDKKLTYEIFMKSQALGYQVNYIESFDPIELINLYSNIDCLVAMRLHSAILCLVSGRPVIGYFDKSWGFKNPGLMKWFNMPYSYLGDGIVFNKKSLAAFNSALATSTANIDSVFMSS